MIEWERERKLLGNEKHLIGYFKQFSNTSSLSLEYFIHDEHLIQLQLPFYDNNISPHYGLSIVDNVG